MNRTLLKYHQLFSVPPLSMQPKTEPLAQHLKTICDQWNNYFQIANCNSQNILCDTIYQWLAHICTAYPIQVYPQNIADTALVVTSATIVIPTPSDNNTIIIILSRTNCPDCQNLYQEIINIIQDQYSTVALSHQHHPYIYRTHQALGDYRIYPTNRGYKVY